MPEFLLKKTTLCCYHFVLLPFVQKSRQPFFLPDHLRMIPKTVRVSSPQTDCVQYGLSAPILFFLLSPMEIGREICLDGGDMEEGGTFPHPGRELCNKRQVPGRKAATFINRRSS